MRYFRRPQLAGKNIKRTVVALEKRLFGRPGEVELVRLMRLSNNT